MSSVNVETLLYEEIGEEFEKLQGVEFGSDQHRTGTDCLTKLMDRAIEMNRIETESRDKAKALESEETLKQQQLVEEKKDRWAKNAIGIAGVVLPLVVTIWGTKVSMKFEKDDSFTTTMGRGFIQRLFPRK